MLTEARRWLDKFCKQYRRPGLPALELSGVYALFPEEELPDFVEYRWNEDYPNAARKGVYLIFGRSGRVLYIGKASLGASIGGRLGTYFAGKNECRLLSTDWTERPTYIATIAVPQGMSFEAAALEEYLIRCLNPCDNGVGVSVVMTTDATPGDLSETAPGAAPPDPNSPAVPLGPGVYTYSAPGMPMCPACGQRPAIFYCSTHGTATCLECVAKHDDRGACLYVPAYRAPKPSETPTNAIGPDKGPATPRPRGILGIG